MLMQNRTSVKVKSKQSSTHRSSRTASVASSDRKRIENEIEQQHLLQAAQVFQEQGPPRYIAQHEEEAKYMIYQQQQNRRHLFSPPVVESGVMLREAEPLLDELEVEVVEDANSMETRIMKVPMQVLVDEAWRNGLQDAKENMRMRDRLLLMFPFMGECLISSDASTIIDSCRIQRAKVLMEAMLQQSKKNQDRWNEEITRLVQIEEGIKRDVEERMILLHAKSRNKVIDFQDSVLLAQAKKLQQNRDEQRVANSRYRRESEKVKFTRDRIYDLETRPSIDKDSALWISLSKRFSNTNVDKELDESDDAMQLFRDVRDVSREARGLIKDSVDDDKSDDGRGTGGDFMAGSDVNEIMIKCMQNALGDSNLPVTYPSVPVKRGVTSVPVQLPDVPSTKIETTVVAPHPQDISAVAVLVTGELVEQQKNTKVADTEIKVEAEPEPLAV